MTVLTIAGAKGGTGKTTTAVNLAAELALGGRRVALQDLDPQASATLALGAEPAEDPFSAEPRNFPPAGGFDGDGKLLLCPAGRSLALAGEPEARALLNGKRDAELLVVDCPPFLGALTIAALGAADLVLVPLQATPLALASLTDVAAVLERLSAPPELRAVLVQVNIRRRLTGDVRRRVREVFPGVLYRTLVPEDVKAAEAPGYGLPLSRYAGWSRAAAAYRQLAREVEKDLKLEV